MKLGEVTICWTPDRPEFPSGMRGKARVFPATAGADEIAPFARRAGRTDCRAQDVRLEIRETWALQIAFVMTERDGLGLEHVHQVMLSIDEYRSGCAEDLISEHVK